MKTTEFKYNLDVILHLTQANQNKKPLDLKILDQYSSFGSVEYFTIPVPIQDFIQKPELLDQYSFKNKGVVLLKVKNSTLRKFTQAKSAVRRFFSTTLLSFLYCY